MAVGLSGGVDSSVTAALLLDEGYDVVGITMEIFDGRVEISESAKHACYGPGEQEDVDAAASVCGQLGIPYHTIDLKEEYRSHVIDYFRLEYRAGRTPNPCVRCNQKLKFGFMLEKARAAGIDFDYFATGHYARIVEDDGRYLLKKSLDQAKDQTYFIYGLSSEQLSRTLFPLGEIVKSKTRRLAMSFDLGTADRIESQDFIAGGDYGVLFDKKDEKEGDIVDLKGQMLGKHRGIIHYTIGQRRGLGIASPNPLYVVRIDAENNRVVVSDKEDIFKQGLIAGDLRFNTKETLDQPVRLQAKIRLTHKEADATVFPMDNGRIKVLFDDPQMSISPGQSVVLYDEDIVRGGGIIEQVI